MSKTLQLDTMSIDALWALYDDVRKVLTNKMTDQQRIIERRLRDLSPSSVPSVVPSDPMKQQGGAKKVRRPYPKVMPNYRNPNDRSETWSGRGNTPRWLSAEIASGKTLEQFLIRRKVSIANKKRQSAAQK